MSRIRTLAVFSLERNVDLVVPKGAHVSRGNPRRWEGVVKVKHDAVYAPDYPHIEAAYEAAGKIVYRPEGVNTTEPEKSADSPVEDQNTIEVVVEESVEVTPWRDLSWPKMRSKATEFTDEPIKNKDMAVEVLEQAEQEGKL